ncbi:PHP domain-containing protein [Candidatus Thorarchaeota archaeon]|nr:MAG: PHP domain-containing protein [Candidatus Thorarchaeota archaeon]
MRARADLHVHSNCSDGIHSPSELVKLAEGLELGGIALTDHDTLEGNPEFMQAIESTDIIGVPGVEVSTEYQGQEIHLLGYFVPMGDSKIDVRLLVLRESRQQRFPKMVMKLRDLGIEVDQTEVDRVLREVESPGRPHLARILIENGDVNDIREAFTKYLATGRPAYVGREKIDLIEAIGILRDSGAVPVLAHPLLIENIDLRRFLQMLKTHGLEGVEVDYGYRKPEHLDKIDRIRKYTQELNLVATGGSDSHGDDGHYKLGSVGVPVDTIEKLRVIAERISRS